MLQDLGLSNVYYSANNFFNSIFSCILSPCFTIHCHHSLLACIFQHVLLVEEECIKYDTPGNMAITYSIPVYAQQLVLFILFRSSTHKVYVTCMVINIVDNAHFIAGLSNN